MIELSEETDFPAMGQSFSPFQVRASWDERMGWGQPVVEPFSEVRVNTAAPVLHYGQSVFEGMKAFASVDGDIRVFRMSDHAVRLRRSAKRLGLPEISDQFFAEAVSRAVWENLSDTPRTIGTSLYLRPLLYATHQSLGPAPARQAEFVVIAGPASTEFRPGQRARTAWASRDVARTSVGGTGDVKCAGNYAIGISVQQRAISQGFDQVIWMDPVELRYVEEMGSMNLFFVSEEDGRTVLTTPALSGSFLPGLTRASTIAVAEDLGMLVREERVDIAELRAAAESGRLTEAFGTGTAAFLTPLGGIADGQGTFRIADGKPGPVFLELWEHLMRVHHGLAPDPHGWLTSVAED